MNGLYTSRIELWGRALHGADLPQPAVPAGLAFERIESGDPRSAAVVARLAEAMRPAPQAEVARRLAAGRRAYLLRADGTVVTYGWVSFADEQIAELEGTIRIDPGEAYIWDCATLPAWRGRGLYPALLRAVARDLAAEGFRWVWIAAKTDNAPSLHGFAKAGYVRIACVRYIRLWSWRHLVVLGDPAAPAPQLAAARRAFTPDRRRQASHQMA